MEQVVKFGYNEHLKYVTDLTNFHDIYESDGYNPYDWPEDVLDSMYGDDSCPCNICLIKTMCKCTDNDMCEKRFDYYKDKLKGN